VLCPPNLSFPQTFLEVSPEEKVQKLVEVLKGLPAGHKTLVFANMKRTCEMLPGPDPSPPPAPPVPLTGARVRAPAPLPPRWGVGPARF